MRGWTGGPRPPAPGSSARGCPGVDDPAFYRLYTAGGEYYPTLIAALAEEAETETGYRRVGAMLVSDDAAELAWIERMARQRAVPAMGEVRRLSAQQAQALFPPLRPELGGVLVSGGARVDGRAICRGAAAGRRTAGGLDLCRPRHAGGGTWAGRWRGRRWPADRG